MRRTLTAIATATLSLALVACSDGSDGGATTTERAERDRDEVFVSTMGAVAPEVLEGAAVTELIEAARAACRAATEAGDDADGVAVITQSLQDAGVVGSPMEAAATTGAAIGAYCPEHRRSG
jgi:hypothetical protein